MVDGTIIAYLPTYSMMDHLDLPIVEVVGTYGYVHIIYFLHLSQSPTLAAGRQGYGYR